MLHEALILTRREVRDSLRDWRIALPMLALALLFPLVMQLAAALVINFGEENGAMGVPFHFIPFGLLVVGFFPIAMSLVIALETFVGERERNSLEPLLASPLSDASLYLGKLLASILPPLASSYLATLSYLTGLYLSRGYLPDPVVLAQIVLLSTVEGLVMVAGAVVVSAHTTSVRAANLLAAAIIIPMGIVVQGESLLLIWGYGDILWAVAAALLVVGLLLARMGIATFNREEILAREADEFRPRWAAERFRHYFLGEGPFSLARVYSRDLPRLFGENRLPLAVASVVALSALVLGVYLADIYVLPPGLLLTGQLQPGFESAIPGSGPLGLPGLSILSILGHNLRTLLVSFALSLVTFGSAALIVLMAPLVLIGYFTAAVGHAGGQPLVFLAAFILPHGVAEILAAILASAFALRLGATIAAGSAGRSVGERWIQALAEWLTVFVFAVIPLLALAAVLEALVTPRVVALLY